MIARSITAKGTAFRLLAPVRGLVSEVAPLTAELETFGPEAVGLAISPEELKGLVDFFLGAGAEPLVPLTGTELNEVRALCRFGEVRVPNPSALATLEWSRLRSLPVAPLDPSEEESAALFTEHIGYFELVRRTVRERRVGRDPPTPASADAFALAWDRTIGEGRGSRRFAEARDDHLVHAAGTIGEGRSRVALVVDRERFETVAERLALPLAEGEAAR